MRVAKFALGRAMDAVGRRDAVEQGRGIVGVSEDRFSKRSHKAQFEGSARIGVDPAKGREIENPGVRLADQRDIGGKDFLVQCLAGRGREIIVERIKPDKAEFFAQNFLAQADRPRLGQKNFGTGEIDFRIRHRHDSQLLAHTASPWRRSRKLDPSKGEKPQSNQQLPISPAALRDRRGRFAATGDVPLNNHHREGSMFSNRNKIITLAGGLTFATALAATPLAPGQVRGFGPRVHNDASLDANLGVLRLIVAQDNSADAHPYRLAESLPDRGTTFTRVALATIPTGKN